LIYQVIEKLRQNR